MAVDGVAVAEVAVVLWIDSRDYWEAKLTKHGRIKERAVVP